MDLIPSMRTKMMVMFIMPVMILQYTVACEGFVLNHPSPHCHRDPLRPVAPATLPPVAAPCGKRSQFRHLLNSKDSDDVQTAERATKQQSLPSSPSSPSGTTGTSSGRKNSSVINDDATQFVSKPMRTYMEDIDTYGVMWHVNYLRAYDRAMHSTWKGVGCAKIARNIDSDKHDDINIGIEVGKDEDKSTGKTVLDHEDWTIVQVNKQKFKTALRLGDDYVVEGSLLQRDSDVRDVWSVTIRSIDDPSVVYNTAKITIARPLGDDQSWIPLPAPFEVEPVARYPFDAQRDEFDPHLTTHLPLPTAMNHMERPRTNVLGGPAILRKMQQEQNLVFFVIAADDLSLVRMDGDGVACRPGDTIMSEIAVVPKKKGTILDIYHTLTMDMKPSSGVDSDAVDGANVKTIRLAQSRITLLAFNEMEQKPAWGIPMWTSDMITCD